MTIQELQSILNKYPSNMEVVVRVESNVIPIGIKWSPCFVDIENNLCLFCDVDERPYCKELIERK